MSVVQRELSLPALARGIHPIGDVVAEVVRGAGVKRGLCNLFLLHTSASLILCENADPQVRVDLERFFSRLVPDGEPSFGHVDEGPDDMPAHVRSVLTQNSLTVPVQAGALRLGTWQGLYLYEHRHARHRRKLVVTLTGEA